MQLLPTTFSQPKAAQDEKGLSNSGILGGVSVGQFLQRRNLRSSFVGAGLSFAGGGSSSGDGLSVSDIVA